MGGASMVVGGWCMGGYPGMGVWVPGNGVMGYPGMGYGQYRDRYWPILACTGQYRPILANTGQYPANTGQYPANTDKYSKMQPKYRKIQQNAAKIMTVFTDTDLDDFPNFNNLWIILKNVVNCEVTLFIHFSGTKVTPSVPLFRAYHYSVGKSANNGQNGKILQDRLI